MPIEELDPVPWPGRMPYSSLGNHAAFAISTSEELCAMTALARLMSGWREIAMATVCCNDRWPVGTRAPASNAGCVAAMGGAVPAGETVAELATCPRDALATKARRKGMRYEIAHRRWQGCGWKSGCMMAEAWS